MTRKEAETLAIIVSHIDNGCSVCVPDACVELNEHSKLFGFKFIYNPDDDNRPVRVEDI